MQFVSNGVLTIGTRMRRILLAGVWSIGGGLGGHALRIINSLIMTRLLVPEMFGVMAVAGIVQMIIAMVSDLGLPHAVMRSPRGTDPEFLNTAWTIQLLRGCGIWLVCLLAAYVLYVAQQNGWVGDGTAYAADVLPAVLAVLTITSVISGFRTTNWFVANRNLDVRPLALIEFGSQLVGLFAMVMVGWYTRSIWALVTGALVTAAAQVALASQYLPGSRNRLCWEKESVRELMSFGKWALGSSICTVFASNGDRLLLGAWVSPTILGLYVLAMNLTGIVIQLSNRLFNSIGIPALSEVVRQDPARFIRAFNRMRKPFDMACVGGAGMLFAVGQILVDIMYDPRYAMSGEIAKALSFLLIFSRYGISLSAYIALGQPSYQTLINFIKLVSIYVFVPIGFMQFGLMGAVWAIALHPLPAVPVYYWLNRRHGLNSIRTDLIAIAWWPIGYGVGFGVDRLYQSLVH